MKLRRWSAKLIETWFCIGKMSPVQRRSQRCQLEVEAMEDRVVPVQGANIISTYVASSPQNIGGHDVNFAQLVKGASVQITSGLVSSEDRLVLNYSGGAAITSSYSAATGTLTLTGNATGIEYANILKSVQYQNIAADPSNGDRGFKVQVGTATYFSGTGNYYQYVGFPSTSSPPQEFF